MIISSKYGDGSKNRKNDFLKFQIGISKSFGNIEEPIDQTALADTTFLTSIKL